MDLESGLESSLINNDYKIPKFYNVILSPSYLMILLLSFTVVGITPGYAGVKNLLIEGGVFTNQCPNSNTSCIQQKQLLDKYANIGLDLTNGVILFTGILVDICGPRFVGLIGIILWTVFIGIGGINSSDGIAWSISFIGISCMCGFIYFAMIMDYIPTIVKNLLKNTNNKSVIITYTGKAIAIMTGVWDMAGLTFLILSKIVFSINSTNINLFWVFIGYALIIGIPSITFILFRYPIRNNVTFSMNLQSNFEELNVKNIYSLCLGYIILTTSVISYGYLFMTHIEQNMISIGATKEEANLYNENFPYILGIVGGFGSLICSMILNFQEKKSMKILMLIESSLALLIGVLNIVPKIVEIPIYLQYINFSIFVIWRINIFAFVNSTLLMFVRSKNAGKVLGIVYSLSGGIALIINLILPSTINWFLVHICFGVVNVITPFVMIYLLNRHCET